MSLGHALLQRSLGKWHPDRIGLLRIRKRRVDARAQSAESVAGPSCSPHHTHSALKPLPLLLLFSCSVMSNSLQTHGLQHARLPCPSPSPGARSNSCLLSRWCHPTISSSVVPYSSCLQSFPVSGSLLMSQLFASHGQNIGASASVSVLPMNIQGWFPLGMTGLISLQSKGLKSLFQHHDSKASILQHPASFMIHLSYAYMTTENHSFD